MTKSAPIQAAVTSVEMLRAALPPSAARLLALIRAEKGDAALLAAVDAMEKALVGNTPSGPDGGVRS